MRLIFSIIILVRRKMRRHSFNQLLICLSLFDILFIICGVPVHAFPVLNLRWLNRISDTWAFAYMYKYFFYPFTTISYSGGVYMTTAITVER